MYFNMSVVLLIFFLVTYYTMEMEAHSLSNVLKCLHDVQEDISIPSDFAKSQDYLIGLFSSYTNSLPGMANENTCRCVFQAFSSLTKHLQQVFSNFSQNSLNNYMDECYKFGENSPSVAVISLPRVTFGKLDIERFLFDRTHMGEIIFSRFKLMITKDIIQFIHWIITKSELAQDCADLKATFHHQAPSGTGKSFMAYSAVAYLRSLSRPVIYLNQYYFGVENIIGSLFVEFLQAGASCLDYLEFCAYSAKIIALFNGLQGDLESEMFYVFRHSIIALHEASKNVKPILILDNYNAVLRDIGKNPYSNRFYHDEARPFGGSQFYKELHKHLESSLSSHFVCFLVGSANGKDYNAALMTNDFQEKTISFNELDTFIYMALREPWKIPFILREPNNSLDCLRDNLLKTFLVDNDCLNALVQITNRIPLYLKRFYDGLYKEIPVKPKPISKEAFLACVKETRVNMVRGLWAEHRKHLLDVNATDKYMKKIHLYLYLGLGIESSQILFVDQRHFIIDRKDEMVDYYRPLIPFYTEWLFSSLKDIFPYIDTYIQSESAMLFRGAAGGHLAEFFFRMVMKSLASNLSPSLSCVRLVNVVSGDVLIAKWNFVEVVHDWESNMCLKTPKMIIPSKQNHPVFDFIISNGHEAYFIQLTIGDILTHLKRDMTFGKKRQKVVSYMSSLKSQYTVKHVYVSTKERIREFQKSFTSWISMDDSESRSVSITLEDIYVIAFEDIDVSFKVLEEVLNKAASFN